MLLMTPGPVPLSKKVLDTLKEPVIHHRTEEFKKIFLETQKKLQSLFETKEPVFVLSATGSGAMECAVVNTLCPGDFVICINSGKFGKRWVEIAETYGLKYLSLDIPWGDVVSEKKLEEALKKHPQTQAVLCQHCETSTGTLHPVKGLCEVTKKHSEALFIVDAVTSIGAVPFCMDSWGVDGALTGSQKGVMAPTGLSLICLSKKARERKSSLPKYYFDLKKEEASLEKGESFFSTPTSLIKALHLSLDSFCPPERKKETLLKVKKRSEGTLRFLKNMGFQIFSKNPSPSLTAFLVPEGVDGILWKKNLEKKHKIAIAGGQEKLKGKIIRIGHMGMMTEEDLLRTLRCLLEELKEFKKDFFTDKKLEEELQKLRSYLTESKSQSK